MGEGLTDLPDVFAISVSLLKMKGTVRDLGLKSIFWPPLDFCSFKLTDRQRQ